MISEGIHGGYSRAGDAGEDIVVVQGIDTIDASDESGPVLSLRHSYVAEQPRLLNDVHQVLRKGQAPPRGTTLRRRKKGAQHYWVFT
jgi:hypothetical protein